MKRSASSWSLMVSRESRIVLSFSIRPSPPLCSPRKAPLRWLVHLGSCQVNKWTWRISTIQLSIKTYLLRTAVMVMMSRLFQHNQEKANLTTRKRHLKLCRLASLMSRFWASLSFRVKSATARKLWCHFSEKKSQSNFLPTIGNVEERVFKKLQQPCRKFSAKLLLKINYRVATQLSLSTSPSLSPTKSYK